MTLSGIRTVAFLILVALSVTQFVSFQSGIVNGQTTALITFTHMATGYKSQTGAFTLGEQAVSGGDTAKICLVYDYFQFNATAGQVLQGHLNSPGQNIYYAIFPSTLYPAFDANAQNCNLDLASKPQVFNSPSALDWTASNTGQYALVFFTGVYYAGPVYFTQQ